MPFDLLSVERRGKEPRMILIERIRRRVHPAYFFLGVSWAAKVKVSPHAVALAVSVHHHGFASCIASDFCSRTIQHQAEVKYQLDSILPQLGEK